VKVKPPCSQVGPGRRRRRSGGLPHCARAPQRRLSIFRPSASLRHARDLAETANPVSCPPSWGRR